MNRLYHFSRIILIYAILLACTQLCPNVNAAESNGAARQTRSYIEDEQVKTNTERSLAYLQEAREYRDQGRYELARQSCLQALAICVDADFIKVIQRELNGIEILLRTMR